MDQLNMIAWLGRTDTSAGKVSESHAEQMHATLGGNLEVAPGKGEVIPALWHWTAFPTTAPTSELGSDGHPRLGDFLPPLRLERRMWASGSVRFRAPLRIGESLRRTSSIHDISEKQTANGPMVMVSIDHTIFGERGLAIEERQNVVYLPLPDSFTPPKKRKMPDAPAYETKHAMPETLLFRYSALTFNAHRIHYDLNYAQNVEHYPGLVVHGPLQAILLMQAAVACKGRVSDEFHYRGVHPMFCGTDLEIAAVEEDDGVALYTGQDGHQGMQATAIWGDTV